MVLSFITKRSNGEGYTFVACARIASLTLNSLETYTEIAIMKGVGDFIQTNTSYQNLAERNRGNKKQRETKYRNI